jgi:hypothetical protein
VPAKIFRTPRELRMLNAVRKKEEEEEEELEHREK